MPPRKRKAAATDPADEPQQAIHIQASATVHRAEGTQVIGAVVNASDAQSIQIGDTVAGDKVLGDLVLGDKIVLNQPPITPTLHQSCCAMLGTMSRLPGKRTGSILRVVSRSR